MDSTQSDALHFKALRTARVILKLRASRKRADTHVRDLATVLEDLRCLQLAKGNVR